jgi:hypothetical protein
MKDALAAFATSAIEMIKEFLSATFWQESFLTPF